MQTGLTAFDTVAKINGISLDLRSIIREFSLGEEEIEVEELLLIMKQFDFKAKVKTLNVDNIPDNYPLPAVILQKNRKYSVLLKADKVKKHVLIYSIEDNKTKDISYEELFELSENKFIILSHKLINSQIKFGFKWFFNEILTYKQVIAEVMLGSFIVQLFGLVTPLFTQVILDKVIVHRSIMTLDVLSFAFVAVMIFELLLNFARKYIFLHTASKIDAKLGA